MGEWKIGDPVPEGTPAGIRAAFGKRMAKRRADAGLTQEDVARRVGVSQPVLSKLERTGVAGEDVLGQLWALYGVPEAYPAAPRDPLRRRAWFEGRNATEWQTGGVATIGAGNPPVAK